MPDASPALFMLTHEFYPKRGGIGTFTEEMARAAVALGYSVELWAQDNVGALPEPSWPFAIRRLPLRGTHGWRCRLTTLRTLIRERRRWRSADLYLCEPGPLLAMMMLPDLPALRPRRLLLTFHGSEILRFHANPITRWLTKRLLRRASRVSVLTDYTEQLLRERFPEASDKVVRTPGAPRSDLPQATTLAIKANSERITILTVGRIHPRKGQQLTLQALAALPPTLRERVHYRIVGCASRPVHEHSLRAAAQASKVAVEFCGVLSDTELTRAYAEADLFVMTSTTHGHSVEGFGLVYLEASAQGLPIVAHRIGGVPEAVRDGETGLLANPDKPAELTAIFARLINDAALRQRLGEAGRKWAQRHSWRQSAEALLKP